MSCPFLANSFLRSRCYQISYTFRSTRPCGKSGYLTRHFSDETNCRIIKFDQVPMSKLVIYGSNLHVSNLPLADVRGDQLEVLFTR